ncbi:TetR/AcrR family transcriptional regulator [Pseudonocardia kunmingensis]|uniref:TetR family transcriptional regulator n=1 Tax=Pseudonocardia kunmingensis TaxID=630975 RepID=A0A543DPE5_9PSEU|nr:TetR/AcrR family transcriptional regulator [Pseudonocardia kunmingensis]TQM11197.1 TetR family transcriptional regulator [Pseudonocardia kunmingensis]
MAARVHAEEAPPGDGGPRRRGPGRPRNSDGARTRRHILDVAARCFARTGYDDTSMQAIADEAGLARTALYNYFRTRTDLARAVLLETSGDPAGSGILRRFWEMSPPRGESARARLRSLLTAGLEDALATPELGELYLRLARESVHDAGLRAALRDYVRGLRRAVDAILADAVAAGELEPGIDREELVDGVLGVSWSLACGFSAAPDERVRAQVVKALDLVLQLPGWRGPAETTL